MEPPLTKVFPRDEPDRDDEDKDDADSRTFVAHGAAGDLAGLVAVSYSGWNRLLIIEDIAAAPPHRGRGVGRALMGLAKEFARERGACHLWLESPTSTRRRSTHTGAWVSPSADSTPPSTKAPPQEVSRRST